MFEELMIYGRILFRQVWHRWMTSKPVITVCGFFAGVLVDIRIYLAAIFVLVIIDMISGIAASLHRGEKFSSRKLRTGLVERAFLYGGLVIIMLMIDTILRGTVNYGRYYVTIVCCTIIGFYEAGSCIENLISRFPNYPFLQSVGKMLNILEDSYEKNTMQKVTDAIQATKILTDEKR